MRYFLVIQYLNVVKVKAYEYVFPDVIFLSPDTKKLEMRDFFFFHFSVKAVPEGETLQETKSLIDQGLFLKAGSN